MPYVALEDVTVHKKDAGADEADATERWGTFSAVTLAPGESIGDDELAQHQVAAYEDGKLNHLLQHVNKKVAAEIQGLLDTGQNFDVKMIKDVVLAADRGGPRKKASEAKEDS